MRKRLRKKKYLEEFAVYGFELSVKVQEDSPEVNDDDFWIDRFLPEAIEENGLMYGGGIGGKRFSGFVMSKKRYGTPGYKQLADLENWLQNQSCIESYRVSEFIDANSDIEPTRFHEWIRGVQHKEINEFLEKLDKFEAESLEKMKKDKRKVK